MQPDHENKTLSGGAEKSIRACEPERHAKLLSWMARRHKIQVVGGLALFGIAMAVWWHHRVPLPDVGEWMPLGDEGQTIRGLLEGPGGDLGVLWDSRIEGTPAKLCRMRARKDGSFEPRVECQPVHPAVDQYRSLGLVQFGERPIVVAGGIVGKKPVLLEALTGKSAPERFWKGTRVPALPLSQAPFQTYTWDMGSNVHLEDVALLEDWFLRSGDDVYRIDPNGQTTDTTVSFGKVGRREYFERDQVQTCSSSRRGVGLITARWHGHMDNPDPHLPPRRYASSRPPLPASRWVFLEKAGWSKPVEGPPLEPHLPLACDAKGNGLIVRGTKSGVEIWRCLPKGCEKETHDFELPSHYKTLGAHWFAERLLVVWVDRTGLVSFRHAAPSEIGEARDHRLFRLWNLPELPVADGPSEANGCSETRQGQLCPKPVPESYVSRVFLNESAAVFFFKEYDEQQQALPARAFQITSAHNASVFYPASN